jgi:hypothetical protein
VDVWRIIHASRHPHFHAVILGTVFTTRIVTF